MNSVLRSIYKTIASTLPFGFLKLLKITKICGSSFSYFTASQLLTPLLGSQISSRELMGVTVFRTIFHLLTTSTLSFFKLFYHLPSLVGAFYFKTVLNGDASYHTRLACALAPITCMALFISNPIGGQAWVYSIYWLIPAIIALMPRTNVFLSALGSTFMTHAIGSVMFLFFSPMTPAFWLTLMPLVLFERLSFATGITLGYYAVIQIKQAVKTCASRLVHA